MWNKCGRGAKLVIMEVYEVKTEVQRLRWRVHEENKFKSFKNPN